eukprot:6678787-Pyramimonas_sp.AAC.1
MRRADDDESVVWGSSMLVPGRVMRIRANFSGDMGRPCTLTHWNIHNHGLDCGVQRRVQALISADLLEAKMEPVKAA